ncbi:MAG: DedA family protein [Bacillota bacterium]
MDTAYHFLGQLGLGGIFLGTIIEALGVPFPGGIMLVLAGVLISEGRLDYISALIMAAIGFNIGAAAAYSIGRVVGEPFFVKFEKFFKIDHGKLEKARAWMEQSAAAFIMLGRFVPMAGNITPYLAGMSRLEPARFFLYNTVFALGWSLLNISVGYYFSKSWHIFMSFTENSLPYIAGAALIVYITAALVIRKKI